MALFTDQVQQDLGIDAFANSLETLTRLGCGKGWGEGWKAGEKSKEVDM